MAQGQTGSRPHRIVRLTPEAEDDRLLAYLYTEQRWGTNQAENYDAFLQAVMQELANHPAAAPFVENLNGVRSRTARWKSARHGHRIFFQEIDEGILVLHILHTAMNWQERFNLKQEN